MKNDCILVVDDDELNRELLEGCLEIAGFDTRIAASGEEALTLLSPDIDLILLDVNMPGMTGFDVAERVRAHPLYSDLPIIMVTALTAKADRLHAVEAGANDFITKPIDNAELSIRMASMLKMKHAQDAVKRQQELLESMVAERTADLQAAYARLQSMSVTDPLTSFLNHRAAVTALETEIERSYQYHRRCAVLLFDIDQFKVVNDNLGHAVGDDLLGAIGGVIRPALRGIDTVGRWGGEEFVVILPETGPEDALKVAEAIRAAIGAHGFAEGEARVTCSVGSAVFPEDAVDRAGLIEAAERALSAAKRLGRNQTRSVSDPLVIAIDSVAEESEANILQGEVAALAMLVSARDCYTGSHTDDVADLARSIALAMGFSIEEADMISLVGQLHDIGKVGIPDAVLRKPSSLSPEEWTLMRTHPTVGADILLQMPTLHHIARAVRAHHERWDGQGYPDQLAGEAIPIAARIVAVADSFGAITTDRPYRQGRSYEIGLDELRRCAGRQFDPKVVQAAVRVILRQHEPRKAA